MPEVTEQIDALLNEAKGDLQAVNDPVELEQFRIKYLGSNGLMKGAMKMLGQVPPADKPALGQRLNTIKQNIADSFEARKSELSKTGSAAPTGIDITEPGRRPQIGHRHILMKVRDELVELFGRMGFTVAEGPEVEDEFHNFVALNISPQHPARDPRDNFYLSADTGDQAARQTMKEALNFHDPERNLRLLRTQTSTVQIRVMETTPPPIRVVIPGRVYRPDTHDATHLSMFHQLEALVVDRNVNMVDLKSTIHQFVHAYFGEQTRLRFRPSFFPFTEPSAEVDVWFEDKQRWIELGGCGMVHPNVLTACKIDPDIFSGWAFGFGIERIAMRKYAVSDIRFFVENDLRFLRQF